MVILDHTLAQQIVDRTMSIIGHNINVMNAAGTIIGSGEAERIGQKHDGAVLALNHGDSLELDEQSCQSLQGVKPGINMLLHFKGEVVGVVGVTGKPEQIRAFAQLVKVTAELTIEQASLVEQLQWDRRHQEEFVSAWLNQQLNDSDLHDWAQRLCIDLVTQRVAVVIELIADNAPVSLSKVREVVDVLYRSEDKPLVAIMSMNEIVVLKPLRSSSTSNSDQSVLERIQRRLTANQIDDVRLAIGQYFDGAKQLPLSYQSAKQVLAVGRRSHPEQTTLSFSEYRIPVLLAPLAESWQGEQLAQAMTSLASADKSGQLVKTLEAYFHANGNANDCANALFIHRNTLRYRLDKISEVTGISTHDFTGLVELYIASHLNKLS
ncbi:sugar diacid recognition domain-containing protein [Vibrio harveyi]|uniref:sugar diacid recognition domain-containing protein n=1 Tax=Vibrio harveyi TaxID=669 RepID=UPI0006824363|nr:sugar diacid recognition domain-containing protein [Vibrio harveyi]AWB02853.1 CdaR family transcriptional regulator [Vibrio harveyi]EKO3821538.1 helix-turn-helix domain-containing protein [Vibrio harveyi]EKO3829434.1 helix-turn-helix domain-containing protein [Vibrio harveyi]MCG9611338.1 helix-turn-helix domain-containing protein [Vibrio harveyi]MCG9669443.1 helix-turn-helix domain-containing protein [Vibrio harveyi]